MKTNLLINFRVTVVVLSLTLLVGLSLPLSAGPLRHFVKQHEQTTEAREDSSGLDLPAPVADDSPINPASTNKDNDSRHQKKNGHENDQRQKKSRH
jgi:hypothetical protein